MGVKFFHEGGQTMTKLMVAFRNFAKNAPKKTDQKGQTEEQLSPHDVTVTEVIKESKGLWNLRQKRYEAYIRLP